MYILFGLVTTFFAVLLEFLFLQGDFSLHDFRPGLVIPAGGLMVGALCASGVYIFLKLKRLRLKPKYFIMGTFFAFLGFWAIYLMDYITAYVDNGIINHSFRGMHIGSFMYDEAPFNFANYLNFLFKNYTVTTYSSGIKLSQNNLGIGFHKFTFALECLGFCLGGLGCGVVAIQGREYCKRCKNDFLRKKLYSFYPEMLDHEIEEVKKHFESKDCFFGYIKNNTYQVNEERPKVEASLKYCLHCKIAYIEYKFMFPKLKDHNIVWIEDKDKYHVIDVPYIICK
ncbi:MAG: hypothetical protein N2645_07875 [Clostridia bacterium]|nr:hypothetical protein [Clostridia bacterium]